MNQTLTENMELSVTPVLESIESRPAIEAITKAHVLSQNQDGLNVVYEVALDEMSGPFSLLIPMAVEVGCPRCYGQGRIFSRLAEADDYQTLTCPRCGGQGYLKTKREIALLVNEAMAADQTVRLLGAGAYDPKSLNRGDLVINLNYINNNLVIN
ncbi:MAG: hypothetical protein LBI10_03870 [Deltaproteobacteria bacterium]|jgi:hypothetical protein|nr:hypothetical protein [Deltaproteobacteria bacterium]